MNSIRTKGLLLFLAASFAITTLQSQNVAINAGGASANLSAILDLDGITGFTGPNGYKGLLIPRMTNAQRTGIVTLPAAAQGLFVYQTDGIEGFYYNISTTTTPNWVYLSSALTGWSTTGNSGTTPSGAALGTTVTNNFIGTTDAKDFVFAANNLERMRLFSTGQLSIGSKTAGAKLDVHQTTTTAVGRFTTYGNTNEIELRRAQGTQAAPTATTVSGTILGRITAQGYDGTGYTTAAAISLETDAAGGTGSDMPGRITFNTVTDGTIILSERMRIDNAGNVGIGTTTPNTTLDVNGAYSARVTAAAAAAALVIPNNISLYRITVTAGVQANALSIVTPQNGQFLTIINEDGDAATFAGYTIPAASTVSGVGTFVYSSASLAWSSISLYPATGSTGWNITGNSGTTASTSSIGTAANNNFIGTTDAKDFVFATNNLERMRIASGGYIGIGVAPIITTHILGSYTSTFGFGFGSQGIMYTATSSNTTSNNNHVGAQFQGKAASGSAVKNLYGLEGDAIMGQSLAAGLSSGRAVGVYGTASSLSGISSTTVGEIYGVLGSPQIFDPLNSTDFAGVASSLFLFSGNPTITNAYLFRGISNSTDINSGTITNLYGIHIPVLAKTGGTVTTAYGAYINSPTAGTTNYGAYLGGNVGIATTTPLTTLDVNGAYSARVTSAAAAAALVIPNNISLYRVTVTAGVQANALSVATPQNGQFLTIINEDGDAATFAGYTIPAASTTSGVGAFVYNSAAAVWNAISLYPSASSGSGWGLTGNAGTDGGATNFLGTTDAKALSIRVGGAGTGFKSGLIDPAAGGSTFFGYQSGKNVAAGANLKATALGYQALSVNTTGGTFNTAVGYLALPVNTDGAHNTAVGAQALQSNVNGYDNTAIGTNSMTATVGDGSGLGEKNTALGYQTLYFNTTGSTNTAIGYLTLNTNTTGTNNTALGAGADVSAAALTNATAIGAGAIVSSSNAVVLGSSASVLIGRSTTVNNAKLSIKDGHIQVSQTTAPTIAVSANAGTGGAASLLAGSNDVTGQITVTEGTAAWAVGVQCTITFNKPYATAPFVVITPVNAAAGAGASLSQVFVPTATTTSFTINFGQAAAANANWRWNYIVIEP